MEVYCTFHPHILLCSCSLDKHTRLICQAKQLLQIYTYIGTHNLTRFCDDIGRLIEFDKNQNSSSLVNTQRSAVLFHPYILLCSCYIDKRARLLHQAKHLLQIDTYIGTHNRTRFCDDIGRLIKFDKNQNSSSLVNTWRSTVLFILLFYCVPAIQTSEQYSYMKQNSCYRYIPILRHITRPDFVTISAG